MAKSAPAFVVNNHPGDALQPNIHPPQVQHLTARFLCPPMPPLVQRPFAGAKSPATSLVVISTVPTRSKSYGAKTSSPLPLDTPEQSMSRNTRLLCAYKDKTPLERIALQAIMVMPGLLLQKPHTKASSKEVNKHLSGRLTLWKAGKIRELLDEARTIQSRLPDQDSRNSTRKIVGFPVFLVTQD